MSFTSSSRSRQHHVQASPAPSASVRSGDTSYSQYTCHEYSARPRTAISTIGVESRQIICAVSESRGISPTVGLAFVNLDTGEAVLSSIADSQSYVRTLHKLAVFSPSQILIVNTASNPNSKLFSIIEENLVDLNSNMTLLDRRYWAETTGVEFIEQLAFTEDVETIKMSVHGNFYSVCSFAAVSFVAVMGS
jgi:DNA mismatch repair protein MSH4